MKRVEYRRLRVHDLNLLMLPREIVRSEPRTFRFFPGLR